MAILPKILGAVVRNESMRLDPQEIYGWRVFALVFAACFGGMLFGWDTGAIGGILSMKATAKQYGYNTKTSAQQADITQNIVSTLQAGCFAACFVTGWAADKFGRRACLIFTGFLTIVGVVFQASSSVRGSLAVMYVGRFIAGLACGAASTLTPLYISECAPRAIRGGLIAFYQLFNVFGIMTSFWVNYACERSYTAPVVFAVPLSLQALPAVFLILGMFFSPESPRWYAKEDHWEKATETLAKLRHLPSNSEYVQNEIRDMSEQLEIERRLTGDATAKTLLKEMFTIPGNRKRAIISIVLMICQQLTGVNAINYYAPFIFANLGLSGDSSKLFATGIYGVVKFVACFIFLVFVADTLGRRRSLIWTAVGQGVVLFIVGIYGRVSPPGKDASGQTLPVSYTCNILTILVNVLTRIGVSFRIRRDCLHLPLGCVSRLPSATRSSTDQYTASSSLAGVRLVGSLSVRFLQLACELPMLPSARLPNGCLTLSALDVSYLPFYRNSNRD